MDHGFLVYLMTTLLHKIKQFLQVCCPWIKNFIAILCCLETDYPHWPINLCHQRLRHNHIWEMLLSILNFTQVLIRIIKQRNNILRKWNKFRCNIHIRMQLNNKQNKPLEVVSELQQQTSIKRPCQPPRSYIFFVTLVSTGRLGVPMHHLKNVTSVTLKRLKSRQPQPESITNLYTEAQKLCKSLQCNSCIVFWYNKNILKGNKNAPY